MEHAAAEKAIDTLFELYRLYGCKDYIGEDISQLDHALQCAALAAWDQRRRSAPSDRANVMIGAALLHDVGQLEAIKMADMNEGKPNDSTQNIYVQGDGTQGVNLGVSAHEHLGADYLMVLGFPTSVTDIIRLHVPAKRYLARSDSYRCSPASKGTLIHQGGPMNDLEAAKFEHHPLFHEAILLRTYDDGAKVAGLESEQLEAYRPILHSLLT